MQQWIESVNDNTDKKIKMILIGNKVDLQREVSKEEGKKMAKVIFRVYDEKGNKYD